jgi:hypothetical protein
MVWSETIRLYNEMVISEKFPTRSGDQASFTRFQDLTQRAALGIILACGFGIPMSWDEEDLKIERKGFRLDEGVSILNDNLLLVTEAPKWFLKLPISKYDWIILTKC